MKVVVHTRGTAENELITYDIRPECANEKCAYAPEAR